MNVIVTDKKYIQERPINNALLVVEDSPSGNPAWRLQKGLYFSFRNRWVNILTVLGIPVSNPNLEDVLTVGNDGGAIQIKNIADPTDDQDAATKIYVDTAVASANPVGSILYLYNNFI